MIHILTFHRISDEISPAFPPMPVKVFEQVLRYLKRKYFIIPIEEIGNPFQSKKTRLVMTFDDAFYDFYENALPLLIKNKVPALQNIITHCTETGKPLWTQRLNKMIEVYFKEGRENELSDFLNIERGAFSKFNAGNLALRLYRQLVKNSDRDDIINYFFTNLGTNYQETQMMEWSHIRESMSFDISIGSHTHSHKNLKLLSENELANELQLSASLIEERTGIRPLSIAYPNGLFNQQVIQTSIECGYKYLLTVEEKALSQSEIGNHFPVIVPRFNLYHTSYWKNYLRLNQISLVTKSTSTTAKSFPGLKDLNNEIICCPVCSSRAFKDLKYFSHVFLSKCEICSLVFSRKKPTKDQLEDYYDQYSYDESYYSSSLTKLRFSSLLDKMEPYRENNLLLDVGCGVGDFLLMAKERGWECLGTELSDAAITICRAKGLKVLKGTLDELSDQLPQFDIITSFEVLEHIQSPNREVQLTYKHLRKGGLFYLTTPNFNSLMRYFLGHRYDAIVFPEHLVYFTPMTLSKLMLENGFEQKSRLVTGFSFSRLRNSLFGSRESPFTPNSLDERFRLFMEKYRVFRSLKNGTDNLFTALNAGMAIKAWFVKKS